MIVKRKCIAMLLAGGQGSRLYALTKKRAKPAVSYGGKYRIIDFPLSNCTHSGIDTVGILTQYEPLELNAYIGNGAPWDLDAMYGGAFVLPPYMRGKTGEWYSGTASAIYQNINFVDKCNPEYIIILSGDHIYTMDYAKMIKAHEDNKADVTIAVRQVPMEEASRFGILNTDENNNILEFEEKPENPKSNNASMGIYVFSWKKLKQYLIEDNNDPESSNDFGQNIIPKMLENNEKLMAYLFSGYWKDVGTVDSLWEANMDLLAKEPQINLGGDNARVYGRNVLSPPHFIGDNATIKNSSICDGCMILGTVENSILSPNVIVEEGAVIKDSVIMQNTVIKANAKIYKSILDEDVTISEGVTVGGSEKITVIGADIVIEANQTVEEGAMIDPVANK